MPVLDRIVDVAAKVIGIIVDRIADKKNEPRKPVPTLDPPLKTLSIDEMVTRARADLERRRREGK
jgi:hypothetical protein